MFAKRSFLGLFIILLFSNRTGAQDIQIIDNEQLNKQAVVEQADTLIRVELDPAELEKIPDLRTEFEKQNRAYTTPATPSKNLLRFLKKNDEASLSPEALYWVNWVRDPSSKFDENITFQDTMIVNPLFIPIYFKGGLFAKDLQLYDPDFFEKQNDKYSIFKPDTTLFQNYKIDRQLEDMAYNYVRLNYPQYFRYSERDLPSDIVQTYIIKKTTYEPELIKVNNDADFSDVTGPAKFIPERRYWISHFESAIQLAQNYISPNWHKGGVSTWNLTNREYFSYNYNKDKIQLVNELEIKTNVFTAPKDTLHDYKVGDDMLRIHSNFGYRAFNKWYYTFDATFQTQLFKNYQENSMQKQAAFLSPFSVNLGLGMKYDLDKKFAKRHKSLTLSVNLAPISYTYMYSVDKEIDLGRHGFKKDPETGEFAHKLSQFGSTINATTTFQINRNISWYSRFYYFTSYDRGLGEFENRVTLAISRFFSTNISLNIRFDDAVDKKPDFDSYFQINELLSFGFNYKW